MSSDGSMSRTLLCFVSLLLLAAAGARVGLMDGASWVDCLRTLAHRVEVGAAEWRHPAVAAQPAVEAGPGPGGQVMQATLELPNQMLVEVGEDITLEELLQKLLEAQTGTHLASKIEIVSVERVTVQRTSPVRTALAALARALHLPASWQHVPSSGDASVNSSASGLTPLSDPSTGVEQQQQQQGAAQLPGSAGSQPGSGSQPGGSSADYGSASSAGHDHAGTADYDDYVEFGSIPDERRLPMAAFSDAFLDGDLDLDADSLDADSLEPAMRKLQQQAAAMQQQQQRALGQQQQPLQPAKLRLFGPRRPALQRVHLDLAAGGGQQGRDAADGAAQDSVVKGAAGGAAVVESLAEEYSVVEGLGEDSGDGAGEGSAPPSIAVRVVVVVRERPASWWWWQGGGSSSGQGPRASPLDQLAVETPAEQERQQVMRLLGRKAAGGSSGSSWTGSITTRIQLLGAAGALGGGASLQQLLQGQGGEELPQLQGQEQGQAQGQGQLEQAAARRALLLAALDMMFVAALVVALVCSVLLMADIRHNGWWHGHAHRCAAGQEEEEELLREPPRLVVVAADEVTAMKGAAAPAAGKQ